VGPAGPGEPGPGGTPQPAAGPRNWQRVLPPDPGALFVYGTLRFPEVLRELLGRVPELTEGTVAGWRVAALIDRTYPGLVRAPDGAATGMLITGLSPAEWQLLDRYEDEDYGIEELILTDERDALTYVWRNDSLAMAHDWSAPDFARQYLAEFALRCRAWRERYDAGLSWRVTDPY
jgi:gamma-glutamylcyclotransferase (GGCT)/AIG2-like uncharacterized protein YtfP